MTPLNRCAIAMVTGYTRFISPLFGPYHCRFHPSCSRYCAQALRHHGLTRGLWLTVKRLGKCHPLHPGGFDPVPGTVAGPVSSTRARVDVCCASDHADEAGRHMAEETQ